MVARANGQAVNIADANTPLAAADNNETDAVNIDDDQVPLAVREDADEVATSIEDETVPLASGASQEAKRRLWWWVLAIVGSIRRIRKVYLRKYLLLKIRMNQIRNSSIVLVTARMGVVTNSV
jgi:hypothetical protein